MLYVSRGEGEVPMKPSTVCRNGHLMEGDNVRTDRHGKRRCRLCSNVWRQQRRRDDRPSRLRPNPDTCAKGHPWSGDNVRITPTGKRICRACEREYSRRNHEKQRRKKGIQPPRRGPSFDVQSALAMLEAGTKRRDVAEHFGLEVETILEWCRKDPSWKLIVSARQQFLHPNSPWPTRDPELIALWATTGRYEIAKIMGLSAGVVAGRIHRLKKLGVLQARPRIKKEVVAAPIKVRAPRIVPVARPKVVPVVVVAEAPVAVAMRPDEPAPAGRITECTWVERRGPMSWSHCDAMTVPGKPYCAEHLRGIYVPGRARGETKDMQLRRIGGGR